MAAVQDALDQSIYRPLSPLSLSSSPMMRRTYTTKAMLARLARSPSASLRPKGLNFRLLQFKT